MRKVDIDNLVTKLEQRVGFLQTVDDGGAPQIKTDLLTSESGLIAQEAELAEPFIDNAKLFRSAFIMGAESTESIAVWASSTIYSIGDKAKATISGKEYTFVSLHDSNVNNAPAFQSDFWESDLSDYLRQKRKRAIKESIMDALRYKNVHSNTRTALDVTPIFAENKRAKDVSISDNFRGMRILLGRIKHIRLQINKIGLYFRGVTSSFDLPIYVYHSSQQSPIFTQNISIPTGTAFTWFALNDLILQYITDAYNTGGAFFIGFYEDDITNGDISTFEWASTDLQPNCPDCIQDIGYWQQFSRYYSLITPVKFGSTALNKPNVMDFGDFYDRNLDSNSASFNLRISAHCNYTYSFEANTSILDKLIQLKTASYILQDIKKQFRINRVSDILAQEIDMALLGAMDGQGNKMQEGILGEIKKELKQISIDLSELDYTCFSKRNQPILRG